MISRILCFLLLSGIIGGAVVPLTTTNAQSDDIATSRVGVVGGYWRPEATDQLTVGWDRITFDWSRFQPNGPSDFVAEAVRPSWIESNTNDGREVVGLIINTPTWASNIPKTGVPSGLFLPYNDPGNLWGVFLTQLAEQYAPLGVSKWIIWNHIDVPNVASNATFSGDVAEYVQLVKVAHQAMNAVDDNAEIYLGGIDWWYDVAADREPYLSRFLQRMAQDETALANGYYFDGVTLNFTMQPNPIGEFAPTVETISSVVSSTRQLLFNEGLLDKEIWINEIGAAVTDDLLRPTPNARIQVSPEQHADFLVQGLALGLANNVDRLGIYRLFDNNYKIGDPAFGLLRDDNVIRPAYSALRYITNLIATYNNVEFGSSTNARLVTFTQTTRTIFVMWSAADIPVSFWIEAAFQDDVRVTDIYGNELEPPRFGVGPGNVTVHVIPTPPATRDDEGNVWVSGSPVIVILETTAERQVWGSLGDAIGVQVR